MNTHVCLVCGWLYSEEKGEPERGIPPGTALADLPVTWFCLICGAPKNHFQVIAAEK
jgi:rubredoxin